MSTYVSIGWIPLVKDADSSSAVASLKGLKDQKLATPGLEHAYHGTPTDPNEPKAAEIIDGEFQLRTGPAPLHWSLTCYNSLVLPGRGQGIRC